MNFVCSIQINFAVILIFNLIFQWNYCNETQNESITSKYIIKLIGYPKTTVVVNNISDNNELSLKKKIFKSYGGHREEVFETDVMSKDKVNFDSIEVPFYNETKSKTNDTDFDFIEYSTSEYNEEDTNETEEEYDDLRPENVGFRIKGGYRCASKDHPYYISLQYWDYLNEVYHMFCGGSILKAYWVVSAATCCTNMIYPTYRAVAGMDVPFPNGTEKGASSGNQWSYVVAEFIHPNHYANESDLCLLELETPILENDIVKYVKLKKGNTESSPIQTCTEGIVLGFGLQHDLDTLEDADPDDIIANKMTCLNLQILHDKMCIRFKVAKYHISKNMFCTYAKSGEMGVCYGDLGSPFVCDGEQVGIVSFGDSCVLKDKVQWITKVDIYYDYIEHVTVTKERIPKVAQQIKSEKSKSNVFYLHIFTIFLSFSINYTQIKIY